jgi:hypothetical protein
MPSSQLIGTPGWQSPPPHTSIPLQERPSLHEAVLFTWRQPVAGTQASSVHGFASSQSGGGPGRQVPPTQVSTPLQKSESPHRIPSV